MANNLKILEQTIEAQIDPNGAPGSILAFNHQNILKDVLNNVGKTTGFHFKAEKDPATIPTGKLSFNGNAFNNLAEFLITVSELSLDLNDFGNILKLYVTGTTIHFKDYVGRSAFFQFISFVAADDGMGNNTYEITVKGFADNSNYTYQDAESENATLSFHANTTVKTKVINFGVAEFDGGITFAAKINELADLSNDYKTGFLNELLFFTGIVYETAQNNKPISTVYILKNQSPGIYGVNGNIVVANTDFIAIEFERGGNGGGFDPLEDPNAFVHDLGEIADGDYLTVINNEPTPFFVIDAETNWYFTLTVGGAAVIVAHVGADGTYGLAQSPMVDADLLIVLDERIIPDIIKFSFACSDETSDLVVETVYEMVILDQMLDVQIIDFGVIEAPTGSGMQFDVQKNDVSIYSTKPTIDLGEFSTINAATQQVLTGTIDFLVGDKLKVIIDIIGSTTAGKNLKARIKHF